MSDPTPLPSDPLSQLKRRVLERDGQPTPVLLDGHLVLVLIECAEAGEQLASSRTWGEEIQASTRLRKAIKALVEVCKTT
jgi:hypothetical protein